MMPRKNITGISIILFFTLYSIFCISHIQTSETLLIATIFLFTILLSLLILNQSLKITSLRELITKKNILIDTNKEMQYSQKAILNNIPDRAWLKDTSGKYIAVNQAFVKAIGLPLEYIIGKTDYDLYQNKTIAENYIKEDIVVLETKERLCIEVPFIDRNGKYSTIEVIKTPIFNDNGNITSIVGIGRDITLRKHLEEQLIQKNIILSKKEETLKEQNKTLLSVQKELDSSLKSLENINLQLQEANKHKNFFLSAMSHEIRTPLNAIIGFTQALELEYFGKLNATQAEYLGLIKESGTHLILLINDILDIAKIDSGSMQFSPENIQINECVSTSVELMRNLYEAKNISLECILNNDIDFVVADRRKCRQVLINLLSNALKYTPSGGLVEVKTEKDNHNRVKISVRDTGVGINSKNIDKIFIDFYQLDNIRDQALGGIGIGLALSKRIVEMHNGEIGVESEENKGSTFWYTLPC